MSNETACEVSLPDVPHHRYLKQKAVKPLKARFLIRLAASGRAVTTVPFELTRIKERHPGTFWTRSSSSAAGAQNLLEEPGSANKTKKEEPEGTVWIPYLKYGRAPLRVHIVAEYRDYGILVRNDGLQMPTWNHTTYAPTIYVDDLLLQHLAQAELAPPKDSKPPIKLQIKLSFWINNNSKRVCTTQIHKLHVP
jgi:hypothetical protein